MRIVAGYLGLVRRWRWSLLLALLIGSILLQPLLGGAGFSRLLNATLFILIFGGAVYAGHPGPRATRAAITLLALALAVQVMSTLGVGHLEYALTSLVLVIVLSALVATFAELLGNREGTPDSLVGAIFGFFVIAAALSLFYRQFETVFPGSFRLPEGGDLDTQLLYFSIITMTTVGYGDITPATPFMQICCALQAAVGTLYIAILIGRIVGQFRPRADQAAEHPGPLSPDPPD